MQLQCYSMAKAELAEAELTKEADKLFREMGLADLNPDALDFFQNPANGASSDWKKKLKIPSVRGVARRTSSGGTALLHLKKKYSTGLVQEQKAARNIKASDLDKSGTLPAGIPKRDSSTKQKSIPSLKQKTLPLLKPKSPSSSKTLPTCKQKTLPTSKQKTLPTCKQKTLPSSKQKLHTSVKQKVPSPKQGATLPLKQKARFGYSSFKAAKTADSTTKKDPPADMKKVAKGVDSSTMKDLPADVKKAVMVVDSATLKDSPADVKPSTPAPGKLPCKESAAPIVWRHSTSITSGSISSPNSGCAHKVGAMNKTVSTGIMHLGNNPLRNNSQPASNNLHVPTNEDPANPPVGDVESFKPRTGPKLTHTRTHSHGSILEADYSVSTKKSCSRYSVHGSIDTDTGNVDRPSLTRGCSADTPEIKICDTAATENKFSFIPAQATPVSHVGSRSPDEVVGCQGKGDRSSGSNTQIVYSRKSSFKVIPVLRTNHSIVHAVHDGGEPKLLKSASKKPRPLSMLSSQRSPMRSASTGHMLEKENKTQRDEKQENEPRLSDAGHEDSSHIPNITQKREGLAKCKSASLIVQSNLPLPVIDSTITSDYANIDDCNIKVAAVRAKANIVDGGKALSSADNSTTTDSVQLSSNVGMLNEKPGSIDIETNNVKADDDQKTKANMDGGKAGSPIVAKLLKSNSNAASKEKSHIVKPNIGPIGQSSVIRKSFNNKTARVGLSQRNCCGQTLTLPSTFRKEVAGESVRNKVAGEGYRKEVAGGSFEKEVVGGKLLDDENMPLKHIPRYACESGDIYSMVNKSKSVTALQVPRSNAFGFTRKTSLPKDFVHGVRSSRINTTNAATAYSTTSTPTVATTTKATVAMTTTATVAMNTTTTVAMNITATVATTTATTTKVLKSHAPLQASLSDTSMVATSGSPVLCSKPMGSFLSSTSSTEMNFIPDRKPERGNHLPIPKRGRSLMGNDQRSKLAFTRSQQSLNENVRDGGGYTEVAPINLVGVDSSPLWLECRNNR